MPGSNIVVLRRPWTSPTGAKPGFANMPPGTVSGTGHGDMLLCGGFSQAVKCTSPIGNAKVPSSVRSPKAPSVTSIQSSPMLFRSPPAKTWNSPLPIALDGMANWKANSPQLPVPETVPPLKSSVLMSGPLLVVRVSASAGEVESTRAAASETAAIDAIVVVRMIWRMIIAPHACST